MFYSSRLNGGNGRRRDWPRQDEPGFDETIASMFEQYRITADDAAIESLTNFNRRIEKIRLRKYQRFVGEYIGRSPYRGLLVYHGLGSGKTLTGLHTMSILGMDTVIMLPAALRGAWQSKLSRRRINHKISFISYNASNFVDQYKRLDLSIAFDPEKNNFDGKFIIIDEAHEFFQNVISGKAQQAIEIYQYLLNARGAKFLFLTGTPIVGDPFEIAICFILLRGHLGQRRLKLFPTMRQEFYRHFTVFVENEMHIANAEIFKERITGLISHYRGPKDPQRVIFPESKKIEVIRCPMGVNQWNTYLRVRQREEDMERKFRFLTKEFVIAQYKKPTRSSIGTYKINSSKVCNFSFPLSVEKRFAEIKINYFQEISHTQTIDSDIWDAVNTQYGFTGPWPRTKQIAEIKWRIMLNMMTLDEILSDIDNYSGKISRILDMVTAERDRKKFIFSKFKVLGTRIISKLLLLKGYRRIQDENDYNNSNDKAFMVIDGDVPNKNELIGLYNSVDNARGEKCQIILGTTVLSRGISLRNVRDIYICEPQWRDTTIEQIRGRASRLFSHKDLPQHERTVNTYVFISTGTMQTTDEFLWALAMKKRAFNKEFLHAIKEAAIDCRLNLEVNQLEGEEQIICKLCPPGLTGVSLFPPDYRDHITSGPVCLTEETEIRLWEVSDHPELKKDSENRLYKLDSDQETWVQIGQISEDGIVEFWQ